MITITNRKVAAFEPRWAPFRGFSLLFDNPGDSVSPMQGDLLKVDCLLDGNGSEDLHLYEGFVRFLDEIGRPGLTNAYLFCPLPSYSYHVTVWDGLNDGNVQDVSPGYRPKLESFLRNLPDSLLTEDEFTSAVRRSPLFTGSDWSVTFKFDKLAKWANQVLVARLAPVGRETENELSRIVNEREALSARFREQFEVGMRSGYTPHVTLGYFANEEYAELATPDVDRWTELARDIVGHCTITFDSIDLYGFVDMVTYFKRTSLCV
jgi:hypothetical protein